MGSLPSDLKSVDTLDMLHSADINALCNGEGIQSLAIGEQLADENMEVGGATQPASNFQGKATIKIKEVDPLEIPQLPNFFAFYFRKLFLFSFSFL